MDISIIIYIKIFFSTVNTTQKENIARSVKLVSTEMLQMEWKMLVSLVPVLFLTISK